jgi:hypothetical protein
MLPRRSSRFVQRRSLRLVTITLADPSFTDQVV